MSKKEVNIIDIIKAVEQNNFSFLDEIGYCNLVFGYFDVKNDVNVFYKLNKEDLNATIDYDGFELSDVKGRKPETIENITYIEFEKNYIYFEFKGQSLYLKLEYQTSTEKKPVICEKAISYFAIENKKYKLYLDDNLVSNFLESL